MFKKLAKVSPLQVGESFQPHTEVWGVTLQDVATLLEGVKVPVAVSLPRGVEMSVGLVGESSRDSYECLALTPQGYLFDTVSVSGQSLSVWLKEQVGTTLYGERGGEYVLKGDTQLYVGYPGYCGWMVYAVYLFEDHVRMMARPSF